ncbi:hypothetical protein [Solirubrobacter soli]|uniref:hypothetical protein n=1 Tax=Solirubrobacter soli TaxID=363832 RepID=UPI0003FBAC3C|nr:hypothetical protein [Solirubrobacter soli]
MSEQEGDGGPGEFEDLIDAVAKESIAWSHPPAGDPKISQAFLLGWRVGLATGKLEDIDYLGLDVVALGKVLKAQITGAATELISEDAIAVPELDDLPAPDSYHQDLLAAIAATDPVLARAFHLGISLQRFCDGDKVTADDTAELKKLLVALASKFPPNAAHSVLNSLTLWEGRTPVGDQLQRQAHVWRPILAGEVAAKDLLHLSDYVGTAEQVVGRLRDVTRQALKGSLRLLVALVLVLIVAGVVLLLNTDTSGGVTAGAGALLAAFGLSWKGIGQYLGRAAAKGEQALWDAQINWTIAYRMTIRDAAIVKPSNATRRKGHQDQWQSWHEKWPDFELDA